MTLPSWSSPLIIISSHMVPERTHSALSVNYKINNGQSNKLKEDWLTLMFSLSLGKFCSGWLGVVEPRSDGISRNLRTMLYHIKQVGNKYSFWIGKWPIGIWTKYHSRLGQSPALWCVLFQEIEPGKYYFKIMPQLRNQNEIQLLPFVWFRRISMLILTKVEITKYKHNQGSSK
jgi:hypothetical protein